MKLLVYKAGHSGSFRKKSSVREEQEGMSAIDRLLEIIQQIAVGKYSDDIMSLTGTDMSEPIRTIAESVGMMMVKVEAREYHLGMLIEELKALNDRIRQNSINTISTMANTLAARDRYTKGHASRVGAWSEQIAREMGLTEDEVEFVRLGGLLHDIGKIGFPDQLFQAHGEKNPPEVIKRIIQHPTTSAEILKELDFLGPALEYVHCHHERPDGKGYPRRLQGEAIPLGAKIIAVADGYDAMTTERPYQTAKIPEQALSILKKGSGSQWDGECVAAFERVLRHGGIVSKAPVDDRRL